MTDARLPDHGTSWDRLEAELLARKAGDHDWRGGRIPLYVYFETDELLDVARGAYALYFSENALGRKAFPSVAALEAEAIQMAQGLFAAPPESGGSFTSGGTESLFLALKAVRDEARTRSPAYSQPNIVIPQTCHATVSKAAHHLGVEVKRTPIGPDFRADVAAMAEAIDGETIMLFASAPGYPHGVYDPVHAIGALAQARNLPLHVDACLGGFLAPFMRDEGEPIPPFDFSVPGVTSLSADLHKYGFAAKGASILLHRDRAMLEHQRFEFRDWPRGLYATDTFLGTRPAGAVASAWAVMRFLGKDGYRRIARTIIETKRRLIAGIENIDGLAVIRPTELSILLYKSIDPKLSIDAVAELLGTRGWFVGRSLEPPAIHLALNPVHGQAVEDYLEDLAWAVAETRATGRTGAADDHTY